MGLIFWGMRNFLLVMDCLNNWITAGKEIASETWLHPFFINKNLKKIQKLLPHQHTFVQIFDELLQIDYDIKTGRLNDQHVWLVLKTVLSKFSSLSLW
jgi:DNA polymerase III delta subunit